MCEGWRPGGTVISLGKLEPSARARRALCVWCWAQPVCTRRLGWDDMIASLRSYILERGAQWQWEGEREAKG